MIASKIVSDTAQTDGRRMIREKHTDDFGTVQFIDYVAERDFDAEQALQDRHAYIEDQNVQADLEKSVETLELPTKASLLEFILKVKELYLLAEGFEVARLATFLVSRGEFEITELRLDFNKIQAEAALYKQVQNLRGA
jgi:hypothetical protein